MNLVFLGITITQDGFVVVTYNYHNIDDHKARKYTQTGTFISLIALHRRGRSENKPQPAGISSYLHRRLLVVDESNKRVQVGILLFNSTIDFNARYEYSLSVYPYFIFY